MSNETVYTLDKRMRMASVDYATKHYFVEFLRQYNGIPFSDDMFQGRILVAGGGTAIVERALFCDPPDFQVPNTRITSIWAVDASNSLKSEIFRSFPLMDRYIHPANSLDIQNRTISYNDEFLDFLQSCPENIFHTITFFGIPNFVDQITEEPELLSSIYRTLLPSGVFMGSGGNYNEVSTLGDKSSNLSTFRECVTSINLFTTLYAEELRYTSPSAPAHDSICVILQKS